MEIQQLKGFYYSARLGSLTKAAEKMAITQSAVSQQIKSLEEELGVPSLLLESDMVDPSSFNEGQTMTRIDAFIELIAEKAKERDWLK